MVVLQIRAEFRYDSNTMSLYDNIFNVKQPALEKVRLNAHIAAL